MKIHPDCIVCLFQQALRTAKMATADESLQSQILTRLAHEIPEKTIQVEVAGRIQALVGELTGVADPYQAVKHRYNDLALALYPELKAILATAKDPLLPKFCPN